MNHLITTYGGGELFALVFNGIAALFHQEGGILIPIIHLSLVVGSVYVVVLMLFKNQPIYGIQWLLWVIVATNLLFLPKTRVHIYDPLHNIHRDVDHVPLALGLVASLTSQVGKSITERLESVFTLPDYMPYHKTGTVFASSLMSQIGRFQIVDPIFKGNMERFVNQCVVYDAMIGQKYTLTDLQNTPNIWELVMTHASPVLGFLYKEAQTPGAIVTCREGARRLNDLWVAEIRRATALYGTRVQTRELNEIAFNTELLGSARLLSGAAAWADSAQNILQQEMMIRAVEEGSNNRLSELGSASHYAATKALLQQRSAYAIAGDIAARTLPLFKNVIEALSYALFIFIVVLALMPNGHKVLLTYCGILVWTQLWAPLYAVLNLVMTLYGQAETLAQGARQGLTILNSSAIINANADMTTLAAWLSVSIPFISYGILRQGAAAFVGLAQHLGSAMQSAASGAAAETVSGNISLGNVTLSNQSYQNTSAFQHTTNPSYRDAEFTSISSSGIEQSTFASGSQALSDHGLSVTPVTLMASVNTSRELQERLHEAESLAQSKTLAAGKSLEEASQKTASLLNRVGTERLSHEGLSKSLTSTEHEALQNHQALVEDLSEQLNVSKAIAHDLAVHIKVGTPENAPLPINFSGSTSLSSTMTNQEALQKAQSITKQSGHTYSLDTAISAAKTLMESKNDTQGVELANAANASFTEAQHLREEASQAQTQVRELSSSLASSQRQDFQESRNVTQEFLEFVAQQPVNTGPSGDQNGQPIGMMGALSILKQGGQAYESYLERFKEAHPQYRIAGVEDQGTEFRKELSQQFGPSSSLKSQNLMSMQQIEEKGRGVGLIGENVTPVLDSEIKTDLEQVSTKIGNRVKDLEAHRQTIDQKVQHASHTHVFPGNFNHAGNALWGVAGDIIEPINIFKPADARANSEKEHPRIPSQEENRRTFQSRDAMIQEHPRKAEEERTEPSSLQQEGPQGFPANKEISQATRGSFRKEKAAFSSAQERRHQISETREAQEPEKDAPASLSSQEEDKRSFPSKKQITQDPK